MENLEAGEVTQLLLALSEGDRSALDKLIPIVYQQLHQIAHRYMKRERQNHTFQTSALVNEAYLRLIDLRAVRWQNRAQFFAIASQMMRNILVDYARTRGYAKRGGDALRVTFDDKNISADERAADLLALDDALNQLAKIDLRQSQVVEMRFFGGLTVEETAEVLSLSPATVKREWSAAKAWLYREMNKMQPDES
jgi:RNA polymerase sigma-70 factor, ECF subfamily